MAMATTKSGSLNEPSDVCCALETAPAFGVASVCAFALEIACLFGNQLWV